MVDVWHEGPSPVPSEEDEKVPGEAPEVLVVDDEAEMQAYLRSVLRPTYRVYTASDGEEALERLRQRPPDLVISDVRMPGRNGIFLCGAIREDETLRHLPVLLLTSGPDDGARRSGVQAGADAYVSKPFDPADQHGVSHRSHSGNGLRPHLSQFEYERYALHAAN
jgi:CheY-like chemotaxis protein